MSKLLTTPITPQTNVATLNPRINIAMYGRCVVSAGEDKELDPWLSGVAVWIVCVDQVVEGDGGGSKRTSVLCRTGAATPGSGADSAPNRVGGQQLQRRA